MILICSLSLLYICVCVSKFQGTIIEDGTKFDFNYFNGKDTHFIFLYHLQFLMGSMFVKLEILKKIATLFPDLKSMWNRKKHSFDQSFCRFE